MIRAGFRRRAHGVADTCVEIQGVCDPGCMQRLVPSWSMADAGRKKPAGAADQRATNKSATFAVCFSV